VSRQQLDLSLGAEWAVLEALCLGVEDDERSAAIGRLLQSPELDWDELLGQALRHQMLCVLADFVLCSAAADSIPFYLAHHLSRVLDLNRWQLTLYRREAARVAAAFGASSIDCVATKGIIFESTIYGGTGSRMLKDVDFMILPGQRDSAAALMEQLGYAPGVYDRRSGAIAPHPRRDQVRYLMQPDHLPRYGRLLNDPCVPYIYVDIANSLTWNKSPYQVPVAAALASRRRHPLPGDEGLELPALAPDYEFLFTALHLFREAWLDNWMELGIDVSLMKFGDIVRLFKRHRETLENGSLLRLLEEHGVSEPVAWVLEHLDRTFGTETLDALGLAGRVDGAWLNAAHPARGRPRRWTGGMRQRLFSRDRADLFITEIE